VIWLVINSADKNIEKLGKLVVGFGMFEYDKVITRLAKEIWIATESISLHSPCLSRFIVDLDILERSNL